MGEAGTVRMLVEAGANTSLRDNEDRTPEVIASRFRRHEIADIIAGAQSGKFRRERQIKRVENIDKSPGDNSSNNYENSWAINEDNKTVIVMNNINDVIERRRLERDEKKRKRLEEDKQFQDEVDFEKSLHDESIWALTLEKEQAEDIGDKDKIILCNARIEEEERLKSRVYTKKEFEWKERKRKEREFQQQLQLKLNRKRGRNEPVKSSKVNDINEENLTKSGEVNDVLKPDEKIFGGVPGEKEKNEDFVVEEESTKPFITFTKVLAVGLLTGIFLRYIFAE